LAPVSEMKTSITKYRSNV